MKNPRDAGEVTERRPRDESLLRLVKTNVSREPLELVVTDVWRIARNEIERPAGIDGGKEIRLDELDAVGDAMLHCVRLRDGKRRRGDVDRHDLGGGQMLCQRDGDRPGARSDVGDPRCVPAAKEIDRPHDELLRLRPRHEHRRRDVEGTREEFLRAGEVGDRLSFPPPLHEFAEPGSVGIRDDRVERRVKKNTAAAPNRREKHLGVEPGRVAAPGREPLRRPREQPADGPRFRIAGCRWGSRRGSRRSSLRPRRNGRKGRPRDLRQAPDEAVRQKAAERVGRDRFLVVHAAAPLEVCRDRDRDGNYRKAESGEIANFPGVSAPYEPPSKPDLVLPTHEWTIARCVDAVVSLLESRGIV